MGFNHHEVFATTCKQFTTQLNIKIKKFYGEITSIHVNSGVNF